MDNQPLEAGQRIGELLFLGHTFARALANRAMRPYGVELRHLGALAYAAEGEPRSQREIVEALGVDKSSMVRTLDDLERMGLVRRRRSPHDRRAYEIQVTPAGRERLQAATRAGAAVMREVLSVLTPTEQEELDRLLSRFVEQARATHARQRSAGRSPVAARP